MRLIAIVIGASALLSALPAAAAPRRHAPQAQPQSAVTQPLRPRRQPLMERVDGQGMVIAVISERELSRTGSTPRP
jgi:CubicO group peptidase (beta-lactamase class C family)